MKWLGEVDFLASVKEEEKEKPVLVKLKGERFYLTGFDGLKAIPHDVGEAIRDLITFKEAMDGRSHASPTPTLCICGRSIDHLGACKEIQEAAHDLRQKRLSRAIRPDEQTWMGFR